MATRTRTRTTTKKAAKPDPLPLKLDGRSLAIDRLDTVRDVVGKLSRVLDAEELVDEYFSTSPIDYLDKDHANALYRWTYADPATRGNEPRPSPVRPAAVWQDIGYRWIAVYPVTGGSEGVYVHVDVIGARIPHPKFPEGSGYTVTSTEHCPVCFVKTWTWENAWKLAKRIAELLEA